MAPYGWLQWFRDKFLVPWWSRYLAIPAIEAAPSALAALWFGLGNKTLHGLQPPWVFFGTAVWGGGVAAGRSALSEYAAFSVTRLVNERNQLLRLIGFVRVIVGAKSRRFSETAAKLTDPIDASTAFLTITQPDSQIREIIRAVHDFIAAEGWVGERIKVSVMEWNNSAGHLHFIAYFPDSHAPRAAPEAFRDTSTIAGRAYLNDDIVISEDLLTDARYQRLGDNEDGSMFAYPVDDDRTRKVALVVNVVSNRVKRFRVKDREALQIPMQVFAERLLLEYRLRTLRHRAEQAREAG